jgi:predicted transcriptional regulator
MNKNDDLIQELKELLRDLHMSPREFGRHIGISEQSIYKWLSGAIPPASKNRLKILHTIALFRTGNFAEELKSIEIEDLILNKLIYDKLKPSLSAEQKGWLLEDGDYLTYHARLRELNAQDRERKAGHES